MLDFNHQPRLHERFTQVIDQALDAERAQQTPRQYLGASRLGVSLRARLQFEYAGAPVDPGKGFSGRDPAHLRSRACPGRSGHPLAASGRL
jgi:hypothetical protein